jgi:glycoside/pentoside/hexuronide:cation symporter, GPH family
MSLYRRFETGASRNAKEIDSTRTAPHTGAMSDAPQPLPRGKLVIFALGQLGWSLASYGVGSLVTYFYMPPDAGGAPTFPPFLFQGIVLGVFTLIGIITAVSRVFDAVTNPLIASWSDRSRARLGRRRIFMAVSAVPFALFSVLVFVPLRHFHEVPSVAASWINVGWLSVTILVFYFFFVMYTAPFNALISELGHNPKERLYISTAISVTWAIGFALGGFVYQFMPLFESAGLDSVGAFQASEAAFAGIALVLMLLPVFFINERLYAGSAVATEGTVQALRSSLRNRGFVAFLGSELLYNVCQMIIQIGLVYYVTILLGLDAALTSLLIGAMFVLSFAYYPLVTWSSLRYEKKRVLMVGFVLLSLLFIMFTFMGILPVNSLAYAWVVVVFAALPNAIFGIVPNAVVADIAEADGIVTGQYKAGMFFGVRSFEINLGMSVANILFPSFLTLGMTVAHPFGIRLSAIVASGICVLGMLVLLAYNEKKVLRTLATKERLSGGAAREAALP